MMYCMSTLDSPLFGTLFDNYDFYGVRYTMLSENTLMLYQQDLQLGPYVVNP